MRKLNVRQFLSITAFLITLLFGLLFVCLYWLSRSEFGLSNFTLTLLNIGLVLLTLAMIMVIVVICEFKYPKE